MNKSIKIICITGALFVFIFILASPSVYAAVPPELNYQGFLGDASGDPVQDGNYLMSFAFYDAPAGGAALWGESRTVNITNGVYSVILGSPSNPIDPSVMDGDLYLGVTVESDPEMTPRQKLTSAAFSIRAAEADTLDGMDSTAFASAAHTHSGNDITSGAVDEAYIDPDIARDSEITWSNLSGIPTDIADGDQVGITSETDPTVIASVKDGVSWGELSGIPSDIADGDDDSGGDITGVTAGTGLSGGGTSGSVTLNVDVPLNLTGSVPGPYQGVISTSNSNSSGYGVYGETTGSDGIGVFGFATNTGNVTNGGGYFVSGGSTGIGVIGWATNNGSDTNYGGYFRSDGSAGRGVYGHATNSGATVNYGGYFRSDGSAGRGVYGSAAGNSAVGVYGQASGSTGRGVYGWASNTGSVTNYGGSFIADGIDGRGVYGEASGSTGRGVYGVAPHPGSVTNYGGYFQANGEYGRGVYGYATGVDGRGVYGEASGSMGRAVYGVATNTGSVTNYGGVFTAFGENGVGVSGSALGTGNVHNYGGQFEAAGDYGTGVYGYASGSHGAGVVGSTPGTNGVGVYGEAMDGGNTTNYGGYFYALGSTGVGVYGYASGSHGTSVVGSTPGTNGVGVYGEAPGTNGRGVWGHGGEYGVYGKGGSYDFYADGPGGNYGPFTGAHDVKFVRDFPEDIRPGMIVSVRGRAEARVKEDGEISLSSTLPTVTVAQKAMDKAVFGVLISEGPLPEDHWYKAQEGERFGVVNALGEGRVLVTDINGEIEAGDYITTSMIPGYGQLQDDDLLHSYTLGKAIETIDWNDVTEVVEIEGNTYRAYLIAVVYTSG